LRIDDGLGGLLECLQCFGFHLRFHFFTPF
jgi:hypothetical protein